MKKELIGFNYKGKKRELEVIKVPWWYEGIGLMFTRQKSAKALLFTSKFPRRFSIFSSFIPYAFIAVWINEQDEVIDLRVVNPGESGIKPSGKFIKLIEIPINKNYDAVVKGLVDKRKL